MAVEIRDMTPGRLEEAVDLGAEIFSSLTRLDKEECESILVASIASDPSSSIIAVDEDRLVGAYLVSDSLDRVYSKDEQISTFLGNLKLIHGVGLFVHDDYRKTGLGSALKTEIRNKFENTHSGIFGVALRDLGNWEIWKQHRFVIPKNHSPDQLSSVELYDPSLRDILHSYYVSSGLADLSPVTKGADAVSSPSNPTSNEFEFPSHSNC